MAEGRPVIFLDCDGVLNTPLTAERVGPFLGLDAVLVARFNTLRERVGAGVVLSSTWRLFPELMAAVEESIPLVGVTPELPQKANPRSAEGRGGEVAMWLREHPEVTRYAIIDDDRDFLPSQPTFFTDSTVGLTAAICEAIVSHLLIGEEGT